MNYFITLCTMTNITSRYSHALWCINEDVVIHHIPRISFFYHISMLESWKVLLFHFSYTPCLDFIVIFGSCNKLPVMLHLLRSLDWRYGVPFDSNLGMVHMTWCNCAPLSLPFQIECFGLNMLFMNTFAQRPSYAHLLDKLESVILWLESTFNPNNFRHELEC